MKLRGPHSGFTIVELLIVVVVIAILAAITIVAFNGVQSRSRDAHRDSSIVFLKKALEFYKIDNDAYPAVCAADNSGCSITLLAGALTPTYMAAIPNDPIASKGFSYVRGTGGVAYGIYIPGYETKPICKTGVNVSAGWWGAGVPTC